MGHIEIAIELAVDNANIYLLTFALFTRLMMNRTRFFSFVWANRIRFGLSFSKMKRSKMFARELSDLAEMEWRWKASAHFSFFSSCCRILFYFVGYRYSIYVHRECSKSWVVGKLWWKMDRERERGIGLRWNVSYSNVNWAYIMLERANQWMNGWSRYRALHLIYFLKLPFNGLVSAHSSPMTFPHTVSFGYGVLLSLSLPLFLYIYYSENALPQCGYSASILCYSYSTLSTFSGQMKLTKIYCSIFLGQQCADRTHSLIDRYMFSYVCKRCVRVWMCGHLRISQSTTNRIHIA